MAIAEYVLHSLTEVDRNVRLVAAAFGPEAIVQEVSSYLSGWSKDRIEDLQKVDGGWGPFDDRQEPAKFRTVTDILRICDTIHKQYDALKDAGIAPTPTLLELDVYLFFVRQVIEDHVPAKSRSYAKAPADNDGNYGHWSDRRGFRGGF